MREPNWMIHLKDGMEFRKPHGNVVYRIVDEEKYRQYWMGRRPSSRAMVEEYLIDPGATQRQVSMDWSGTDGSISAHLKRLIDAGAMEKFKAESNRAPVEQE